MDTLSGIPIVVNEHMPPNSWTVVDNKILTDAMGTIEAEMNFNFLKSCGIYSERPKYIKLPNFSLKLR